MRRSRALGALVGPAAVLASAGIVAAHSFGAHASVRSISIRRSRFHPPVVRVAPGDTIVWRNEDLVPHTVTASDAGWDSGEIPPGGTFTLVFPSTGSVRYVCLYHATMSGDLEVPPQAPGGR